VRVRWLADQARWRVSVRSRSDATTLALVELDDATGEIVRREALPPGELPARHTEREAIDAAVADREVRAAAREWGGVEALRAAGRIDGCCWEVDLFQPDRTDGDPADPVVRVDVHDASLEVSGVWTGIQIPWSMARGEREGFGGDVNRPGVWYALCALFALVVVDWRRLRSLANLDALALLAFAASYEAFVRGAVEWSVPLAVPPLAWLTVRMAWLFARGVPAAPPPREPRTRLQRLALRRVPTVLLVVLCVLLAGIRIGLTVEGGNVIDVGYAGVAGARLELEGTAPWGNMPDDVRRGDTYGPANYLAYVPATALLDDPGDSFGTGLPAAQATSIAADLAAASLLLLIGWRWLGRRAGVLLVAGWLACPWTTLVMAAGANDSLVAVALLAAFAALPRAWLRGGFVALAALVKVAPAIALAPLLHAGTRARLRQSIAAAAGFAVVLALGIAWAAWRLHTGSLGSDLHLLWERTVAFQAGRDSPFSPWGMYDLHLPQQLLRVAVVAGAVLACVRPRARDAWQVAAGIAALLAAVQLTAGHWFYLYLPWLVPFVLIVLVARRERPGPPPAAPDMLTQ
jgi:hypothetical protein